MQWTAAAGAPLTSRVSSTPPGNDSDDDDDDRDDVIMSPSGSLPGSSPSSSRIRTGAGSSGLTPATPAQYRCTRPVITEQIITVQYRFTKPDLPWDTAF